jgi:hypothetical protein
MDTNISREQNASMFRVKVSQLRKYAGYKGGKNMKRGQTVEEQQTFS